MIPTVVCFSSTPVFCFVVSDVAYLKLKTELSDVWNGIFMASYGYLTSFPIRGMPFLFIAKKFKLVFTWILNNYDKFYQIHLNRKVDNCSNFESKHSLLESCFSYKYSGRNKNKNNLVLIFGKKMSWTDASKICQDIGASLPYLTDTHKVDELLAVLKLSHEMIPLLFVFIGLKYDSQKVSRSLAQADFLKKKEY